MNKSTIQIIVCDDDVDINESIAISLKHDGYKVIKCFNGKEAIDALNKNHIDLIDINESLKNINALPYSRAIYIDNRNIILIFNVIN